MQIPSLIEYLEALPKVYCKCPVCFSIFRLGEANLTYGKEAKRNLLDKMRELEGNIAIERKDAIQRSKAVRRGLVAEQLYPFMSQCGYNPHDMRFIGNPIDYISFIGLTNKKYVKELKIIEVKSNSITPLTDRQKSIQNAVERGKVSFELIRIED